MMTQTGGRAGVAASSLLALVLAAGCTGGTESTAAEEHAPQKNGVTPAAPAEQTVDLRGTLKEISPAIPVYAGARFREDLTRRDAVMVRNQYGPQAEVYTLATDDSYPQVFHYYTTYLAQFRGFPAQDTYPSPNQNWRTLEVPLNDAMRDPFIPGEAIKPGSKQVILQLAETEAEPKTVIRYIIAPAPPAAAVASAPPTDTAAAR